MYLTVIVKDILKEIAEEVNETDNMKILNQDCYRPNALLLHMLYSSNYFYF